MIFKIIGLAILVAASPVSHKKPSVDTTKKSYSTYDSVGKRTGKIKQGLSGKYRIYDRKGRFVGTVKTNRR